MTWTDRAKGKGTATLDRALGPFDGVFILLAVVIGSGIYSVPQRIAAYHSSFGPILAYWILGGVFVYVAGLVYAELGTRLPVTGGEYIYLTRCFGPHVGFVFGWKSFVLSAPSARAALAVISADYVGFFVKLSSTLHTAVAVLTLLLMGTLNYVGIRRVVAYQKLSTWVKLAGLALLLVIGLFALGGERNLLGSHSPPTADLHPLGGAAVTMLLIFFTYTGWARVVYVAEEMKNPRRTVPVAMLVGIAVVVLVYVLINVLYHQVLGMEGVRAHKAVASAVATELIGPFGAALVAIVVVVSASGSMSVSMMSASRLYYAMAKDGLFFRWLDYVHPVFRTPSRAIAAHFVCAVLMLLLKKNFVDLVTTAVFVNLIFYVFKALALFRARALQIGDDRAFRVPLYPVLPAIFVLGIVALLACRVVYDWERAGTDLLIVALGIPLSLIWCRGKRLEA